MLLEILLPVAKARFPCLKTLVDYGLRYAFVLVAKLHSSHLYLEVVLCFHMNNQIKLASSNFSSNSTDTRVGSMEQPHPHSFQLAG